MIKYKIVHCFNDICYENCPYHLDEAFQRFWKSRALYSCDHAFIAQEGKKIIGFFRFDNLEGTLYGAGTYILPAYRKLGIAKKLWNKAIKYYNPHSIEVCITSSGAEKLINSLKEYHSDINFCVV